MVKSTLATTKIFLMGKSKVLPMCIPVPIKKLTEVEMHLAASKQPPVLLRAPLTAFTVAREEGRG